MEWGLHLPGVGLEGSSMSRLVCRGQAQQQEAGCASSKAVRTPPGPFPAESARPEGAKDDCGPL